MGRIAKQDVENLLIETGHELFWKFGFWRVSVGEICKKAGISKMTFYRYFDNKTELAKRVLKKVVDEGTVKFREILTDGDTISGKMQRIIRLKMEGTNDISREFVEDVYNDTGSEIQQFMIKLTTDTWMGVIEEFRDAQKRGIFRQDFKPEILLAMSRGITEMVANPQLNALYSSTQEMIVEIVNLMTYGIAPRDSVK
jgi:AcrR family transcriptional regulator